MLEDELEIAVQQGDAMEYICKYQQLSSKLYENRHEMTPEQRQQTIAIDQEMRQKCQNLQFDLQRTTSSIRTFILQILNLGL